MSDSEALAFDPLLEQYETFQEPEALVQGEMAEGTNASRFTIAGLLTAAHRRAAWDVRQVAEEFGFASAPFEALEQGDPPHERELSVLADSTRSNDPYSSRMVAWERLNEGESAARYTLLVMGLCGRSERESVAAAIGILDRPGAVVVSPPCRDPQLGELHDSNWFQNVVLAISTVGVFDEDQGLGWDGASWEESCMERLTSARSLDELDAIVTWLATARLGIARGSDDAVTREFAFAFGLRGPDADEVEITSPVDAFERRAPGQMSILVHGTWGWEGDWWYPGGDFHEYSRLRLRPNTYDGGRAFGWSGRLRDRDRAVAGDRLVDWIDDPGAAISGIDTVFAHSYGGEVVARAINLGASIDRMVLLSVPSSPHVLSAIDRVAASADVRLKWDIVLGLAGRGQRIPDHPNMASVMIEDKFWRHGVTHSPELWHAKDIAKLIGL